MFQQRLWLFKLHDLTLLPSISHLCLLAGGLHVRQAEAVRCPQQQLVDCIWLTSYTSLSAQLPGRFMAGSATSSQSIGAMVPKPTGLKQPIRTCAHPQIHQQAKRLEHSEWPVLSLKARNSG